MLRGIDLTSAKKIKLVYCYTFEIYKTLKSDEEKLSLSTFFITP